MSFFGGGIESGALATHDRRWLLAERRPLNKESCGGTVDVLVDCGLGAAALTIACVVGTGGLVTLLGFSNETRLGTALREDKDEAADFVDPLFRLAGLYPFKSCKVRRGSKSKRPEGRANGARC